MALTEAQINAAISSTNAKIAQLISATGNPGDYSNMDVKVNRAAMIKVLGERLDSLNQQLDNIPAEEIATLDINSDPDTGEDLTEYVEDI